MFRTAVYWIKQYQEKGALWIHDGNPKRPHALLTSGKHSNGFFNSRLVIPDEKLMREAAQDLANSFIQNDHMMHEIDCVVGPQTGATKLAELISHELSERRGRRCSWASPAKDGDGEDKRMVFDNPKQTVKPGENVLLCEDVLTTGGSVELTTSAVVSAGGNVLSAVVVLVNRSGIMDVGGKKIMALIDRTMPMWEPDKCPLCMIGSKAIRPKGTENWACLNAPYKEEM